MELSCDIFFSISIYLELPELLKFCSINTKIYNKIYKKDYIWLKLLDRDFKEKPLDISNVPNNPKDLYILLWGLSDLKKELKLKKNIYTLYSLKALDLSDKNLTKLPSSIRFLRNLKSLYLSHNYIQELPNNLPPSLNQIFLANNQMKKIPNNLPPSLQFLGISNNYLEELPNKFPDSLRELYVYNNFHLENNEINRIKLIYPNMIIKY